MNYTTLTDDVAVGEPPGSPSDIQGLADEQFQSILSLRGLDEQCEFSSRDEGVSARTSGLMFLNDPTNGEDIDETVVEAFEAKLGLLPPPTYVHSGESSLALALSLIAAARHQNWTVEQTLEKARRLEFGNLEDDWIQLIHDSMKRST